MKSIIANVLKLGVGIVVACCYAAPMSAAEIRLFFPGAYSEVGAALFPEFEKLTGHKINAVGDTMGGLAKRVANGETFDLLIATPEFFASLDRSAVVSGQPVEIARTAIGVVVKEGAAIPDISTVEAFKRALLAAKSVLVASPAAGGSNATYVAQMLDQLGVREQLKGRLSETVGVARGIVAGEAELGVDSVALIVMMKGARLVGPAPKEIQKYSIYSGAPATASKAAAPARELLQFLARPAQGDVLRANGFEAPAR